MSCFCNIIIDHTVSMAYSSFPGTHTIKPARNDFKAEDTVEHFYAAIGCVCASGAAIPPLPFAAA